MFDYILRGSFYLPEESKWQDSGCYDNQNLELHLPKGFISISMNGELILDRKLKFHFVAVSKETKSEVFVGDIIAPVMGERSPKGARLWIEGERNSDEFFELETILDTLEQEFNSRT